MMTTSNKEIVFITGANTGIGFELAKQLLSKHGDRFFIVIGARNLEKGAAAVKALQDLGLHGCECIQIDVDKDESIAKAADQINEKYGKLDVLHANAGIMADLTDPDVPNFATLIMKTMRTNVAGAAQTAEAFLPLLQKSTSTPRLIFMSSSLGSLDRAAKTGSVKMAPAYCASKAAVNMLMLYYAHKYPDMKVNACAPGYRVTQLTNFGAGIPIEAGALENGTVNAVRLTLLGKDGESGLFTEVPDGATEPKPWAW